MALLVSHAAYTTTCCGGFTFWRVRSVAEIPCEGCQPYITDQSIAFPFEQVVISSPKPSGNDDSFPSEGLSIECLNDSERRFSLRRWFYHHLVLKQVFCRSIRVLQSGKRWRWKLCSWHRMAEREKEILSNCWEARIATENNVVGSTGSRFEIQAIMRCGIRGSQKIVTSR